MPIARLGGFAFFYFETEHGHDFLEIFPDFGFCAGIAEKISGVIRGHKFVASEIEPLAAELGDATIGLEQSLCGARTEANDNFGRDGIELAEEEGRASGDLIFLGQAIFRRPAFYDVADVDVLAAESHGFDHLVQKFSGAADKGQPLRVFIGAGTFANENELGFGMAVGEDDVFSRFVEFAAGAVAEVLADFKERVAGDFVDGVKQRRAR
jgi:hypothetical protein